MLNIINQIMDVCIPQDRASRDFCVKFPEEIRHDNLAGQLWFGAEVAAAAGLQGHGVGIVQPFLCEPWSALEHGPDWGVWGAPVAGQGGDRRHVTWGSVGPPLLPAPVTGAQVTVRASVISAMAALDLRETRGSRPRVPEMPSPERAE